MTGEIEIHRVLSLMAEIRKLHTSGPLPPMPDGYNEAVHRVLTVPPTAFLKNIKKTDDGRLIAIPPRWLVATRDTLRKARNKEIRRKRNA